MEQVSGLFIIYYYINISVSVNSCNYYWLHVLYGYETRTATLNERLDTMWEQSGMVNTVAKRQAVPNK
jgi:hypothetical protein